MRKISEKELRTILKLHQKYILGDEQGVKADLFGVDLQGICPRNDNLAGANLAGANLDQADLSRTNLNEACLYKASLEGACLFKTGLCKASLVRANLRGANLSEADLNGACLQNSDLSRTCLMSARLKTADIRNANLYEADLYYANLSYANLDGADLIKARLDHTLLTGVKNFYAPMACPSDGSFIGWKKALAEDRLHTVIVKLEILEDAKRSSATGRKCRCDKARIVAIYGYGKEKEELQTAISLYDETFIYTVGEIVSVDNFDEDRFRECSTGIHFFITREEAENWRA